MIDRRHIEQILKLNGLTPDSPDEEIKSLLISARWHEDDVETALVVLREDVKDKTQHIDTLHRVFRSDQGLNPDTLNAILGIDVEVQSVTSEHRKSLERSYKRQLLSIAIISVVFSAAFLVALMWFAKVGFFHEYV